MKMPEHVFTNDKYSMLFIRGEWTKALEKYVIDNRVEGLYFNASAWNGDNLDFLANVPFVRYVQIIDTDLKSIGGLNALPNLEYLSVRAFCKTKLNFPAWNLKECYFEWIPGNESLFECNTLKRLYLYGYPGEFEPLLSLSLLEDLTFNGNRRVTSIAGIEKLKKLHTLKLYRLQKLYDLNGIQELPLLRNLEIECCKKLADISPIGRCVDLSTCLLDNCGNIPSLKNLSDCKELERLSFIDTVIEDGDLDFLESMPKLRKASFVNKKHYSIKRENLWKMFDDKWGPTKRGVVR